MSNQLDVAAAQVGTAYRDMLASVGTDGNSLTNQESPSEFAENVAQDFRRKLLKAIASAGAAATSAGTEVLAIDATTSRLFRPLSSDLTLVASAHTGGIWRVESRLDGLDDWLLAGYVSHSGLIMMQVSTRLTYRIVGGTVGARIFALPVTLL